MSNHNTYYNTRRNAPERPAAAALVWDPTGPAPPEILATRRDLEQLADGRKDTAVMSGWRREVIGERLLAAL